MTSFNHKTERLEEPQNPLPIHLPQFPNETKTCCGYKRRILIQKPALHPSAWARLFFVSHSLSSNLTGQAGLAWLPALAWEVLPTGLMNVQQDGCQVQAPPWLLICSQGSPMAFWPALLPPLFVGQLYQPGCWCVQSQVLAFVWLISTVKFQILLL